VTSATELEHLLRPLAPEVLGALVRRHGRFDVCEDAVQEALIAAIAQWPQAGVPENPRGWLLTVASRRLVDEIRADVARRRREQRAAEVGVPSGDEPIAASAGDHDDTLALLFLCCHESLTAPSQIALTLRAVGGLTTAEIASAFLVPEATMAQRISRAKSAIKAAGAAFELPSRAGEDPRLGVVLHVLYLIFNEGYTASSGAHIQRVTLAEEAIRLSRTLHRLLPANGEVSGLLALMLLTHARHRARTSAEGALIPLAEQDRTTWDRAAIAEGVSLVTGALADGIVGPFALQAAIAAVHAEAPVTAATDWREITALYELLERIAPNPVFTVNRAVAVAMLRGPAAGLHLLDSVAGDDRLAASHRVPAVRGHLLELAGDRPGAAAAYLAAARLTMSLPERDYLQRRAAAVAASDVTRHDVQAGPDGEAAPGARPTRVTSDLDVSRGDVGAL
jgi:RNA polymerase sigma factor (sigma-70 family)